MRLTIRRTLLGGFALLIALIATISILGRQHSAEVGRQMDALYQNNLRAAVQLANAQDALWQLRYGFPQFLVLTRPEDRKNIVDDEPRLYKLLEDNLAKYKAG